MDMDRSSHVSYHPALFHSAGVLALECREVTVLVVPYVRVQAELGRPRDPRVLR
jgi:hypothetical protein